MADGTELPQRKEPATGRLAVYATDRAVAPMPANIPRADDDTHDVPDAALPTRGPHRGGTRQRGRDLFRSAEPSSPPPRGGGRSVGVSKGACGTGRIAPSHRDARDRGGDRLGPPRAGQRARNGPLPVLRPHGRPKRPQDRGLLPWIQPPAEGDDRTDFRPLVVGEKRPCAHAAALRHGPPPACGGSPTSSR